MSVTSGQTILLVEDDAPQRKTLTGFLEKRGYTVLEADSAKARQFTMLSDDALYLGMANPMNLLTDPLDDKPEGGWELLRLSLPDSWTAIYLPIVLR